MTSKQDYGTPREVLDAVEARFGRIAWDLAAHEGNHITPAWFGPGGVAPDALAQPWHDLPPGLLWLNPPFADLAPWAYRAATSGRVVAMLTPASIGSCWFRDLVHRRALVLGLAPRLTFEGCTAPYPKDLMLSVFGVEPGFDVWTWR